ncbi:MAG: DUF58 domain-containing protein [Candidatus Omnitrophota bacterium]
MRIHNPFYQKRAYKVITAIITVIAFIVTTLGGDITWAENVPTFHLPPSLGCIEDSRKTDFERDMVIHIQDAHCNYAGQKKISEIIKYLNKKYNIRTVNLEGGEGEYDLSPFTKIKDKDLREKVSDYFVKRGIINGAEYFAVNNPEKVKLWGIENTDLYLKNLNIYRESIKHKEEIDEYLKSSETSLNNLKQRTYSKELLEFDQKSINYQENQIELKEYLTYLLSLQIVIPEFAEGEYPGPIKYNNLSTLYQSFTQEQTIDFPRADTERDKLIDALQKTLSRTELKELVSKTIEFKEENISQKDFYAYLVTKAICAGLDLEEFPELKKYISYISAYEAIDKTKIITEIKNLENEIKERLFENEEQRNLDRLSTQLLLTKKLFNLTLTRDEYKYYLSSRASEASRGILKNMEKFYEYSFQRDQSFLQNLTANDQRPTTILITGGFHSENLRKLFKQKGISYISIMPNFKNEEGYKCPYFELLKGNILTKTSMMAIYSCLCAEKTQKVHQISSEDINATIDSTIDLFKNGVEKTKIIDRLIRHIEEIEEGYKKAILVLLNDIPDNAAEHIKTLNNEYENIVKQINSYLEILDKDGVLYQAIKGYKDRLKGLHQDVLDVYRVYPGEGKKEEILIGKIWTKWETGQNDNLKALSREKNELNGIESKIQKAEKELKRITDNLDWIEEREKRIRNKLDPSTRHAPYGAWLAQDDRVSKKLKNRLNSFEVYKAVHIETINGLEREIGNWCKEWDEKEQALKSALQMQAINLADNLKREFEYHVYLYSFLSKGAENKDIIIDALSNSDELSRIKEETPRRIAARNLFSEMTIEGNIALPEASRRGAGTESTDGYWGVYKAFNFTDVFKNDAAVKNMVNEEIEADYRGLEEDSRFPPSGTSRGNDKASRHPEAKPKDLKTKQFESGNEKRALRKKVLAGILGVIWGVALFLPICRWMVKKHINRSVKEKPPVASVVKEKEEQKIEEKEPIDIDIAAIVKAGISKGFFMQGGVKFNQEKLNNIRSRVKDLERSLMENNQKIAEYKEKIQSAILTSELKQASTNLKEQARELKSTIKNDYEAIFHQEWKTVSVKAGDIDLVEGLSRLQDAKDNGPEIKDYSTREKIGRGEGNLYPDIWVADAFTMTGQPISSHLSIKSFSTINPLTNEFVSSESKWKKLKFGQTRISGECTIMPVNGREILPLALPPDKIIVDVQPDLKSKCGEINVYYDEANMAWYLEFDNAPESVRVMTRSAEKDELGELPFIEIEDSVKDTWQNNIPGPMRIILKYAKDLSDEDWSEVKRRVFELYYYSTNPYLGPENFSLNCDGLTMLDAIFSHARGERMCVQIGFLDLNNDGRFYAVHDKGDHVFSLTSNGVEDKTSWVGETSALYGKEASPQDWQKEEEYVKGRADLASARLKDIADFVEKKQETKALEKEKRDADKEIDGLKIPDKEYGDAAYYKNLIQYYDKQIEELSHVMVQNKEESFGLAKNILTECENFVFSDATIKDEYQLMAVGHFLLKVLSEQIMPETVAAGFSPREIRNAIYEKIKQYAEMKGWNLQEPLDGHVPGIFYKARWRGQKEDLIITKMKKREPIRSGNIEIVWVTSEQVVTDSLTGKTREIPDNAEIIDYQNGILWIRKYMINGNHEIDRLIIREGLNYEFKIEQLLLAHRGAWIAISNPGDKGDNVFLGAVIRKDGGLEGKVWHTFNDSHRKGYLKANGSFIGMGADNVTKGADIDDSWNLNCWHYFGVFNGETIDTRMVEDGKDWDNILEPLFFNDTWAGAGRTETGDWEIVGSGKDEIERIADGRKIVDWKNLSGNSFIILIDNGDGTQSFIGPGAVEFGIDGSFLRIGRPIKKILEAYSEGLVVTLDKTKLPFSGHIRFWGPLAYRADFNGKGLFYGRHGHPKFTSDGKWVTAVIDAEKKWSFIGTLVEEEVKNMRFNKIIGVNEGDENAIMVFSDNSWGAFVFLNRNPEEPADGPEYWAIIGSPDIMAKYPGTFEAWPEQGKRPFLLSDGSYMYRFGVNSYHYDGAWRKNWLTRVIDLYDIGSISAAGHLREDRLDIWWRYVDNLAKQDKTLAATEMEVLLAHMEELLNAEKDKVYTAENPCSAYIVNYDELREIVNRNSEIISYLSSDGIARLFKFLNEARAEYLITRKLVDNSVKNRDIKQRIREAITKCSFSPEEWERILLKSIQHCFSDYKKGSFSGPYIIPFMFSKEHWKELQDVNSLVPNNADFLYISAIMENIDAFNIPLPEKNLDLFYDAIKSKFSFLHRWCGRDEMFDAELTSDTRNKPLYKTIQFLRKVSVWLKLRYNARPRGSAWLKDGENIKKWREINQQLTDILGDDVAGGKTLDSKALWAMFWKELVHDAIGFLFLVGFVSVFMSFVSDKLKMRDKNIGSSAGKTLKTMWKHAKHFRGKRAEDAYSFLKEISKDPSKNLSYGQKARLEIIRQTLPEDRRAIFDVMCAVALEVPYEKKGIFKRLLNILPGIALLTSIDSLKFRKRQAMNRDLVKLIKTIDENTKIGEIYNCVREIVEKYKNTDSRLRGDDKENEKDSSLLSFPRKRESMFNKTKQMIVKLLKQTNNLYVISSPIHSPKPNGSSKSGPGEGGEFLENKEYAWGDDTRRINWNKYASTNKLVVKVTETDITKDADILINMRTLFDDKQKDIWISDLARSMIAVFDKKRLKSRDKFLFNRFIFIMPDGTIEVEKNTRAKAYGIRKDGLSNMLLMLEDKYTRAKVMADTKDLKFYTDEQNKRHAERIIGVFSGEKRTLDNLDELLAKLKIKNKHVFSVGIEEKDKENLSFLLGKRTITALFWKQNTAQPYTRRALNELKSLLSIGTPGERAGPVIGGSWFANINYMKYWAPVIETVVPFGLSAPVWAVLVFYGGGIWAGCIAAGFFWLPHLFFRGKEAFLSKSVVALTMGTAAVGTAVFGSGLFNAVSLGLMGILILTHYAINWHVVKNIEVSKRVGWVKSVGLTLTSIIIFTSFLGYCGLRLIGEDFSLKYAFQLPVPIESIGIPQKRKNLSIEIDEAIKNGMTNRVFWEKQFKDYPENEKVSDLITNVQLSLKVIEGGRSINSYYKEIMDRWDKAGQPSFYEWERKDPEQFWKAVAASTQIRDVQDKYIDAEKDLTLPFEPYEVKYALKKGELNSKNFCKYGPLEWWLREFGEEIEALDLLQLLGMDWRGHIRDIIASNRYVSRETLIQFLDDKDEKARKTAKYNIDRRNNTDWAAKHSKEDFEYYSAMTHGELLECIKNSNVIERRDIVDLMIGRYNADLPLVVVLVFLNDEELVKYFLADNYLQNYIFDRYGHIGGRVLEMRRYWREKAQDIPYDALIQLIAKENVFKKYGRKFSKNIWNNVPITSEPGKDITLFIKTIDEAVRSLESPQSISNHPNEKADSSMSSGGAWLGNAESPETRLPEKSPLEGATKTIIIKDSESMDNLVENAARTAKEVVLQEEKEIHSFVIVGDRIFAEQEEAVSAADMGELKKNIRKMFGHKRKNHIHICKSYEEAKTILEKIEGLDWQNTFFYVDSRIKEARGEPVFDRFIKMTLKTEDDGSILMAAPVSGYTAYSQIYSDLIKKVQNLRNAGENEDAITREAKPLIEAMAKIKDVGQKHAFADTSLISGIIRLVGACGKASEIIGYIKKYQNQHTWSLPYVKEVDWKGFLERFKAEAKILRSL